MAAEKRKFFQKLQTSSKLWPPFHLRYWKWIRLAVLMTVDVMLISLCYYAAYVLRLDSMTLDGFWDVFITTLPALVVLHLVSFYFGGMYRQVWRFANLNSAVTVGRSVLVGTLLSVLANFMLELPRMPPRSVPVIYLLLATLSIAIVRFSWRVWSSFRISVSTNFGKERCFIYGAGAAGELMARHAVANPNFPYQIVGFIDDDRNKAGRLLHGLKILGSGNDLGDLAQARGVTTVIIALHVASGKAVRDIVAKCMGAGIKPLIMPDLANALGTDVIQPRAIDVKDLLRRSPKSIDRELVGKFFVGRSVLITGAGGSIGSEICRQLLSLAPNEIILFDSSEYNLYRVEMELRQNGASNIKIHAVMGSAIDRRLVQRVFEHYKPWCVFHAAAYKHVSLVERNPLVGIVNNILGTRSIAEAALSSGVKHFLLISTDKAVRPTSVMGTTKRCCEMIIQSMNILAEGRCKFSSVRFGNVLNSSGSVIPRFMEQIQAGGPVTVTHPDVTRFFMLIPEAVALCLQAISMAKGGEIYVLNMGEPVKILEMARQLILLAGKEPGKDVEIIYTGLQPGEKLYEELILEGVEEKTQHEDLFVATPQDIDAPALMRSVSGLLDLAYAGEEAKCLQRLRSLIVHTADENATDSRVLSQDEMQPRIH